MEMRFGGLEKVLGRGKQRKAQGKEHERPGEGGETEVVIKIKRKIGRRQETRTRISSVPNAGTQLDFRRYCWLGPTAQTAGIN